MPDSKPKDYRHEALAFCIGLAVFTTMMYYTTRNPCPSGKTMELEYIMPSDGRIVAQVNMRYLPQKLVCR